MNTEELLKAYEDLLFYAQAFRDEFGPGKATLEDLAFAKQRIAELKSSRSQGRFALLAGDTYYPQPGWKGFDSWHDSLESAIGRGQEITTTESLTWYQVLDTQNFTVVAGSGEAHTGLFGKVSCEVRPIHHVFSTRGESVKDSRWETATLKEILEVVGQTAAESPESVFTVVEI